MAQERGAHQSNQTGQPAISSLRCTAAIKIPLPGVPPKNPTEAGDERGPFTHHLERVAAFGLIVLGVLGILAVLFPPGVGSVPLEGIEVTKPPWMLYWFFGLENYVGVTGILYGAIAFLAVLVAIPFVDRGPKRHWRSRPSAIGTIDHPRNQGLPELRNAEPRLD